MTEKHRSPYRNPGRRPGAGLLAAGLALALVVLSLGLTACGSDKESKTQKNANAKANAKADPSTRAVFQEINAKLRQQRASIAKPVLAKAVVTKKITLPQSDALGARFAQAGKKGRKRGGKLDQCDKSVRAVRTDLLVAAAKRRIQIAKPIVAKAVKDGRIDQQQADQLTKQIEQAPKAASRKPKLDPCNKGARDVAKKARRAFRQGGQQAAKAVIDKAVRDKKITKSQASVIERRSTRQPKNSGGK